jgi:hypothetical protein
MAAAALQGTGALSIAPTQLAGTATQFIAATGALLTAALELAGDGEVEILPEPGEPLVRETLTVFEPDGTLVGFLLADVRWTVRLNGSNDIESIVIPREYLLSSGISLSKLAYLDDGWYVEWQGYRYVLQNMDGDLETGLTAQAIDAATELSNYYCSYSAGAAVYLNQLPSAIASAVLSGRCGRQVRNPGFGILDAANLPTNWSHPANWTSALVSNRYTWRAPAGSSESYSDERPCTPGIKYQVSLNVMQPIGSTGDAGVLLRWIRADGSTVDSAASYLTTRNGAFHAVSTGELTAQGVKLRIVLKTASTSNYAYFDDVRLYEVGPSTGYTYSGTMDSRPASVPYTDGAITRYGVWTEGAGYLQSSTAGDYIGRVLNGPFVSISFAAGGSGAQARIRVNGVSYQASGSSLVRGTAAIDVSTAKTLTLSGLDPTNDHLVEVEVAAGTVRFSGFTVSTDNLVSMSYDVGTTVYEALAGLQKAVGGELWFDTVSHVVHHQATRGQNLKANNIVEFRRGLNIVSMRRRRDRSKIVNRLTGLGYGEGEYQLVTTVDAVSTDDAGQTSQDIYGVRRGTYTDKDCKSLVAMTSTLQNLVEQSCWETVSYDVEVLDSAAALCSPGDTGHFVYGDVNVELRIIEIERATGSGAARLVVASRADDLADYIVSTGRELATLQKSYQGVPSDANDSFSEQFERTSSGTDVAAVIPFFIPYGADLLDLRARYEVGGMRAYAKGAASGGGSTSGAGGSSTPTSSSGGAATPTSSSGGGTTSTSSSVSTPSGGGSTSGSTSQDVVVSPGTSRSIEANTTNAWATVAAWALNAATYPTQRVLVGVFNRSGGNRIFDLEIGTSLGDDSIYSSTLTVGANEVKWISVTLGGGAGNSMYARLRPGTTSSSSYDIAVLIVGYASHTHSTPNHTHPTHDHTVTIGNHTHTVTIGNHTHTVTIPNHTHSTPAHTHDLVYGIYESAAPATVRVYLDGSLITALNDLTLVSDFDLLPYVTKDSNGRVAEGWHTLEFTSATAGATGSVRGCLFQRKFISTEAA